MPLKLKKRPDSEYFHITGTFRWGEISIPVRQSTGCRIRAEAEQVLLDVKAKLLAEVKGESVKNSHKTFGEAAVEYLRRDNFIHPLDIKKVEILSEWFADKRISEINASSWAEFVGLRLKEYEYGGPNNRRKRPYSRETINRTRAIFMAVINYAKDLWGTPVPKIPKQKIDDPVPRFLSYEEQERLLNEYAEHLKPLAIFLCYSGCRLAEALRLKPDDVYLGQKQCIIRTTKTRKPRYIPLHKRVLEAITPLMGGERVFKTPEGKPYKMKYGASIATGHNAACRRAGIIDFSPHNWRSHWASHFMMKNKNSEALKKIGGWRSDRAIQHYVALSKSSLHEEINNMD